jgi:hypothetical protein
MTANVTAVNDAPTASNRTITTNEDTARALAVADFGFADVDAGNTLQSVTLTSLPTAGSLKLNGVAVTANQVVSVADITAGHLIFTPAANANGLGYASFGFKVSDGSVAILSDLHDDRGCHRRERRTDAANRTITTNEDTARALAVADFGFVDVDAGNTLQSVTLTSLPTGRQPEVERPRRHRQPGRFRKPTSAPASSSSPRPPTPTAALTPVSASRSVTAPRCPQ